MHLEMILAALGLRHIGYKLLTLGLIAALGCSGVLRQAHAVSDQWLYFKETARENLDRSQNLISKIPDDPNVPKIKKYPGPMQVLVGAIGGWIAEQIIVDYVDYLRTRFIQFADEQRRNLAVAFLRSQKNAEIFGHASQAFADYASATMPIDISRPAISFNKPATPFNKVFAPIYVMAPGDEVEIRTHVVFRRAGGDVQTAQKLARELQPILAKVNGSATMLDVLASLRRTLEGAYRYFKNDLVVRGGYTPWLLPLMEEADYEAWVRSNSDTIHFNGGDQPPRENSLLVSLTVSDPTGALAIPDHAPRYPRRYKAVHPGMVSITASIQPALSRFVGQGGHQTVLARIIVKPQPQQPRSPLPPQAGPPAPRPPNLAHAPAQGTSPPWSANLPLPPAGRPAAPQAPNASHDPCQPPFPSCPYYANGKAWKGNLVCGRCQLAEPGT